MPIGRNLFHERDQFAVPFIPIDKYYNINFSVRYIERLAT